MQEIQHRKSEGDEATQSIKETQNSNSIYMDQN